MSTDWHIFKGRDPDTKVEDYRPQAPAEFPDPPMWRNFKRQAGTGLTQKARRGQTFFPSEEERDMVNAALYLRRPLLVTGKPGTGKTSLAYAVAYELDLGEVLYWPITTRTTLKDGLYSYDAIGRMQDFQLRGKTKDRIGKYIRLGPLGTAFYPSNDGKPRVLLIDEIDKSDIDLPNNLLHIFEDGEYAIPELERIADEEEHRIVPVLTAYRDRAEGTFQETVPIEGGRVPCQEFPLVILTSNGERDFPPAFLRRCLRLDIKEPDEARLKQIVSAQLEMEAADLPEAAAELIREFLAERAGDGTRSGKFLATDQLLNAVYLLANNKAPKALQEKLFRALDK